MLMDEAPAVVAGVGVIVTGVVGYLTGKRKNSGSVSTTTADVLWDEARSIRADLGQQIDALRRERAEKDAEHARQLKELKDQYEREIAELRLTILQKDEQNAHKDALIVRLTERVNELELEIERVKTRERKVAETLADKEAAG